MRVLLGGPIGRGCVWIWLVLSFERCDMVKTIHGFGAVPWHGDADPTPSVVPRNSEAKVSCPVPVLGSLVELVQRLQEVVGMFPSDVFDSKVINTEGKRDWSPVVLPKTWCNGALMVAFCNKTFFKELLCNDASLWQPVHTFLDTDIYVPIFCSNGA